LLPEATDPSADRSICNAMLLIEIPLVFSIGHPMQIHPCQALLKISGKGNTDTVILPAQSGHLF
jgi:hypothetical protein